MGASELLYHLGTGFARIGPFSLTFTAPCVPKNSAKWAKPEFCDMLFSRCSGLYFFLYLLVSIKRVAVSISLSTPRTRRMMNSHAVETLSKMPGETKARPLPNTPSPPIGFWASPNDSPGLTTATSSPSICSSPSMSRNDSVHSILVLWDGGNDAQECLIPQGNFCSGLGLGMGSKSTSEEIPDDVSLAGGGSNKGDTPPLWYSSSS